MRDHGQPMSAEEAIRDQGPGTLRVLPYTIADGPANMAIDEAMMESSAREDRCYLRFYEWSEPTLSLGYFQRMAEVESDPRWRGRAIVRRPTGGGAIWHHHELTYAIAAPSGLPHVRPNTSMYRAVHAAIASVLAVRGADARRRGEPGEPKAPAGAARPLLCFRGSDPEDLVWQGHKIVGSAQRRREGVLLQHGSILLGRSPDVPELPGLRDLSGPDGAPEAWAGALAPAIAEALGLVPESSDWPAGLRDRADELERSRYRDPAWTASR